MRVLLLRALMLVSVAATTLVASAMPTTARADILINAPAAKTCASRGVIKVGVWYKAIGSTDRVYAIRIFDPRGRVVFYRHGVAPSSNWAMWRYRPRGVGVYRTVYYPRTRFSTFTTRVVRCRQPSLVTIGSETASGDFAIAVAGGSVKRPRAVYVRIEASPFQNVSVSWTIVCSRGFGAGSRSGQYDTDNSSLHAVTFPMANPDDCTVSASGQLEDSGSIVVTLLAAK